jgi:hypothetical protein
MHWYDDNYDDMYKLTWHWNLNFLSLVSESRGFKNSRCASKWVCSLVCSSKFSIDM